VNDGPTAYLTEKCDVQNHDSVRGKAVFAREAIAPGEVVAVWSGCIVHAHALDELPPEIRSHTVQIEEDLYLASLTADEAPDFINHSCDPNCGLDGQITIIALRHILPGEQVSIDYAMCDGSPYDEFDCGCGSHVCRGRVTGDDWRNPALWARYAGHFSPYLQRRIDALQSALPRRFRRRRNVETVARETSGASA